MVEMKEEGMEGVEASMSAVRHVLLSPHLDDAVLSCGASIALQRAGGESVEVLTIFAGHPRLDLLSFYAAKLHEAAGNPPDMVGTRRGENEAACRVLVAVPVCLDYLDAPYRTDPANGAFLYTSDEQLMGGHLHPADFGLVDELAAAIAQHYDRFQNTLFHAPLAAGGHVDHLIVRAAALKLEQRGFAFCFYEDYPYVEQGHPLVSALARPGGRGWMAELRLVQEPHVTLKCEAIACYRSQIPVLFGDAEAMVCRVREHMILVGGGAGYAERFWVSCPSHNPVWLGGR